MNRPSIVPLLSQFFQHLPEGGKGLGDAGGVADDDAADAQTDESQAHRHAVVLVGIEFRPAERARDDSEAVRVFFDGCADFAELRRQRGGRSVSQHAATHL